MEGAAMDVDVERAGPLAAQSPEQREKKFSLHVPPPPPPKDFPSRPGTAMSRTDAAMSPLPRPGMVIDRPGTAMSAISRPGTAMSAMSRPGTAMSGLPRPGTAMSAIDRPGTAMTASSKRLSFSSIAAARRKVKYGTGKHAGLELIPQPSDDPNDPLNWSTWRKELNLGALLLMVALTGSMKTAFISTNAAMAINYNVSYTAVAALTAVPLMISALTGLVSLITARLWGKRPVYLVSLASVFIGSMWAMRTADSYAQCMASRVFQGLGWGAFDTLVLGSIQDTYFEHQRNLRIAIYNIIAVTTTWGPPILGGLASQSTLRFALQFEIINAFMAVAVPLIVLGAPETAFDRAWNGLMETPATGASQLNSNRHSPLRPRVGGRFNFKAIKDAALEHSKAYLAKVPFASYEGKRDLPTILEAPRAFVAPTTATLFLVSFMPYCALWGFSETLCQLFGTMPFLLLPTSLGLLMTGPFIFSAVAVTFFSLYRPYRENFTPKYNLYTLAAGTVLGSTGILAFGLTVYRVMATVSQPADGATTFPLSFPVVSFLLGFLAAGTFVLDGTSRPMIWRSTEFTSSNYGVCLRNFADMSAGVGCWRTLLAGVFILAFSDRMFLPAGLKGITIGLGVAQLLLVGVVGGLWWYFEENIRRMDGQVMGLVDLSMLKQASFFDTD